MPPVLFLMAVPMMNAGPLLGIPAIVEGFLPHTAPTKLFIAGVTRNASGAILGSCLVTLYRTVDNLVMEQLTSDPVTGAFAFSSVGLSETYYVVAYKGGVGDVAGTTINTLVGA